MNGLLDFRKKNFGKALPPPARENRIASLAVALASFLVWFPLAVHAGDSTQSPGENAGPREKRGPIFWLNPIDGDWNDPTMWSGGFAPTATDIVLIDAGPGTYTVRIWTGDEQALDVFVGGSGGGLPTLSLDAHRLQTMGPCFVDTNGRIDILNGGRLENMTASMLTNNGVIVMENMSNIDFTTVNNATFFVKGANNLVSQPFINQVTGSVTVEGTDLRGDATLLFDDPGGMTNMGTIDLTAIDNVHGATLGVVNGPLTSTTGAQIFSSIGTGGTRDLQARLVNNGTLTVDQFLNIDKPSVPHFNDTNGMIVLSAADLLVNQNGAGASFTNDGTISINSGNTFMVQGGQFFPGMGSVNVFAAKQKMGPFLEDVHFENVTVIGATMDVAYTLVMKNCIVDSSAGIDNQAALFLLANNQINGIFTNTAASQTHIRGTAADGSSQASFANGLMNLGTFVLQSDDPGAGSVLDVPGGAFQNTMNGMLQVNAGAGGPRGISAELQNDGLVFFNHDATLNMVNASHLNSATGSIDVNGVIVQLIQSAGGAFTNQGAVNLMAPALLKIQGGSYVPDTGGVTRRPQEKAKLGPISTFEMEGVTVAGGTLVNQTFLLLKNCLFDVTSPLVNQGEIVAHGANTLSGGFQNDATHTLRVEGFPGFGASVWTMANPVSNFGEIRLDAPASGDDAQLVSGGLFTNEVSGIVLSLPGMAGGNRVIQGPLDNQGLIEVHYDLSIQAADTTHTNTGSIHLMNASSLNILDTNPVAPLGQLQNLGFLTLDPGGVVVLQDSELRNDFNGVEQGTVDGEGVIDAVVGSFLNDGFLFPGFSAGTLNVNGDMNQLPNAFTAMEIGGPTAGVDFDQINVNGNLDFSGILDIQLIGGFEPTLGQTFQLISFGSATNIGNLNISLPTLPNGLVFAATFNATNLLLDVQPVGPIPTTQLFGVEETQNNIIAADAATGNQNTVINVGLLPKNQAATWDGNLLYVPNSGDGSVTVVDARQDMPIATIPGFVTPLGVAFTPDDSQAWILDQEAGAQGTVEIFDTSTNLPIGTIADPCFLAPDSIAINRITQHAYVGNGTNGQVCVLDIQTNAPVTSVNVGGAPIDIVVLPDGSSFFVSNAAGGSVARVDALTFGITPIPIPIAGAVPGGMDVTDDGAKLYVATKTDQLAVIDTVNNGVTPIVFPGASNLFSVAIVSEFDRGYAADPNSNAIFILDLLTNLPILPPIDLFTGVPGTLTSNKVVPIPPIPGIFELTANTYQGLESDGFIDVTVTRLLGTDGMVSVNVDSMDGTAVEGDDYQMVSAMLTFPDGDATPQTVSVPILDDVLIEGTEFFTVNLNNPTGGAGLGPISTAQVTILDDELPPSPGTLQLTADSLSVFEGSPGLAVQVVRVGGSDGQVKCDLTSTQDTALAGIDYQDITQTVTFEDGDNQPKIALVPIIDDDIMEFLERFTVSLTNPTGGATIGTPSQAMVQISDDDIAAVSWEIAEQTVTETDPGQKRDRSVGVQARLSNPADRSIVVPVTVEGTATPGTDYVLQGTSITFPAGTTSRNFGLTVLGDLVDEPNETIVLTLGAGNAALGQPETTTVIVRDDDDPPSVNWDVVPAEVLEGFGALKAAVPVLVQARLSQPSGFEVQVPFSVAGSASLGSDHDLEAGTLVFPPGDRTSSLTFQLLDDGLVEATETLVLTLLDPQNASLGNDSQRLIRILDDDRPTVRWSEAGQTVVEDDNGKRSIAVTLTAVLDMPPLETVEVAYFVGGTATSGIDHDLTAGTLSFEPGQTSASLNLNVLGDTLQEPTEVAAITLADTPFRRGAPYRYLLVIQDDDPGQAPETQILRPGNDSVHTLGGPVVLEASGSDPQGDSLSFFWDICSTTGHCSSREGRLLEDVSFAEPGRYLLTCYARDDQGNQDPTPAQAAIDVVDNIPPTVTIVDPPGEVLNLALNLSFTFSAEVEDPDSENVATEWFLASDPESTVSGLTYTRSFAAAGSYSIACRARDEQGGQATDWVLVRVSETGEAPTGVSIDSPDDRTMISVGETIDFNGLLTGPLDKRRDLSFFWDLGDGRRLPGQQLAEISFERAGRYLVRLFAVDSVTGDRFRDAIVLHVVNPALPPVVDINLPTDIELQPAGTAKRAASSEVFLTAFTTENQGYPRLNYFWSVDGGESFRQATPGRIAFQEPGVYTVSLFGVTPSGMQSETVTRTVTVRVSEDSRFEPNETFGQAPVVTPGNYENLLLDDDSLTDVYRVEVPRDGQRLSFKLNSEDAAKVEIYDSDLTLVTSELVGAQGSVQAQGLRAGQYFVRVSPAPNAKRSGFGYSLAVAVLTPALFFPEIRVSESFQTQLGMVNTTGEESALEARGYDAQGQIVARVPLVLAPLGRCHMDITELFGNDADRIAWVQVDSDHDLVGYSRTVSTDADEVYALTAGKSLSAELFVPHIAEQVEQWFTRASVINGSDQPSISEVQTPTQVEALTLDSGFSLDTFDFLGKFGGALPAGAVWATLKETGENFSLAGVEVFGTLDGSRVTAGLELADIRQNNPNFTYIANNLYFTHVARDVGNFYTGIALVNIGDLQQNVRIRAYGPGGALVGAKELTLGPRSKLVQLAEAFLQGIGSPANVDWFLVEAGSEVVGFELFGTRDGTRLAGLEATTGLREEICFPFIDEDTDVSHGISVVNVNDVAATVVFSLYDDRGESLAQQERLLNPHEKLSITIEALFGDSGIPDDRVAGWLGCSSDLPLAGFELFVNDENQRQMGAIVAQ